MNTHYSHSEDPELPFGNALKNADGFKVPELYFEKGEELILGQCNSEWSQDAKETKGFQIPDGYFDQFADSLMRKITRDSLAFIPASDGFKVPENYFEKFPDRLQIKLSEKQQTTTVKRVHFRKIWYWAAAACLFGAVGLFGLKWSQNQTSENLLSQCSEEELLEYLTIYADEFDEQSLAMLLEEADIDQLDIINEFDESAEELLIEYLE